MLLAVLSETLLLRIRYVVLSMNIALLTALIVLPFLFVCLPWAVMYIASACLTLLGVVTSCLPFFSCLSSMLFSYSGRLRARLDRFVNLVLQVLQRL